MPLQWDTALMIQSFGTISGEDFRTNDFLNLYSSHLASPLGNIRLLEGVLREQWICFLEKAK